MLYRNIFISVGDPDPDPPDPWPFLEDPGSVKIMPYGSMITDP